jgi:hypothetical protein
LNSILESQKSKRIFHRVCDDEGFAGTQLLAAATAPSKGDASVARKRTARRRFSKDVQPLRLLPF